MADEDVMFMDENQGMDTGDNNSGMHHEPMEDSFGDDGETRNGGARDRSRSPIDRMSGKKKRGNLTSKVVYVHNLSYQCSWQQLKDFFKENVGEVKFAELVMKQNGDPSGVGAVQFHTFEKAQQAIDQITGVKFMDRVLNVKSDTKSSSRLNKIVGSRDRRGMRSDFDDYSNKMGGGFMSGGFGGRSMGMGGGFGGSNQGFGGALGDTGGVDPNILDQLGIMGPVTSSVFVGNLNYEKTTEDNIREVFSLAGEVKEIELFEDKEGTFLGRAVVRYSEPIEAVQAISMLHNQNLMDRNIIVSMDKKAEKGGNKMKNLPSGLKSVGMGLGVCGAPLTKSKKKKVPTATLR